MARNIFANDNTAVRTGPVESIKLSEFIANLQLQAKRNAIRKETNNPTLTDDLTDAIIYIRENPLATPLLNSARPSFRTNSELRRINEDHRALVDEIKNINTGLRVFGYSDLSDRQAELNPELVRANLRSAKADAAGKIVTAATIPLGMGWLKGIDIPLYRGANAAIAAVSGYDWYKNGPNFWNVTGAVLGGLDLTRGAAPIIARGFQTARNNLFLYHNFKLLGENLPLATSDKTFYSPSVSDPSRGFTHIGKHKGLDIYVQNADIDNLASEGFTYKGAISHVSYEDGVRSSRPFGYGIRPLDSSHKTRGNEYFIKVLNDLFKKHDINDAILYPDVQEFKLLTPYIKDSYGNYIKDESVFDRNKFSYVSGMASKPTLISYISKNKPSIYIHENVSHLTDKYVDESIKQLYERLVGLLFRKYNPKAIDSKKWEELRATLNELREKYFNEGLLSTNGKVDLNNLDKIPTSKLLEDLSRINQYGEDYVNGIIRLNPGPGGLNKIPTVYFPETKKTIEALRTVMKTAPIVAAPLMLEPNKKATLQ